MYKKNYIYQRSTFTYTYYKYTRSFIVAKIECVCVCVCVCSDGKTLAAGGRSNLLHLWCLESRQLLRVVQMPPKVRTVRQLEFLHDSLDGGTSQVLGRIRGTSRSSDMCDTDVWRDIRRLSFVSSHSTAIDLHQNSN